MIQFNKSFLDWSLLNRDKNLQSNNVHFLTAACKQVSLETTKPTSDVIFENLDLILANVVTLQRKLNVISCTHQGSHSDDGFVLELNLLALITAHN